MSGPAGFEDDTALSKSTKAEIQPLPSFPANAAAHSNLFQRITKKSNTEYGRNTVPAPTFRGRGCWRAQLIEQASCTGAARLRWGTRVQAPVQGRLAD
jgi:hypothetical protein